MSPLFAYFDPSAGSLLLQAIVGGFGGIVIVGRFIWSQLRRSQPKQVDAA